MKALPLSCLLLAFSCSAQMSIASTCDNKCSAPYHTVCRVVDGDTIWASDYDKSIRILGIDTLESKPNRRAYKQATNANVDVDKIVEQGKVAKSFAIKTLQDECILLTKSKINSDRDKYKRYLRFVDIKQEDGDLDYGLFAIKQGYALLYTQAHHEREGNYQEAFLNKTKNHIVLK